MNPYEINGQATAWVVDQLAGIGYKNIREFKRGKTSFIIILKDGRKFGFAIDPLI